MAVLMRSIGWSGGTTLVAWIREHRTFLGIGALFGFRYYRVLVSRAQTDIVAWCRELAACSDVTGSTSRTYLSAATREAHGLVRERMERAGCTVRVDAVGNVRGFYPGSDANRPRFLIGSHIDTVPDAGAFDGVLGVAIGIELVERLQGRKLAFGVEVIAFSEEEGVRFGVPFIGSRALIGTVDRELLKAKDSSGVTLEQAIRDFGLDPDELANAQLDPNVAGYLEFHIEQGPVLESLNAPIGVVEAIAGQSRMTFTFVGAANHAGTTPMHLRRDALAAAAEWIAGVEKEARKVPGLVATVGRIEATPGAGNVIAGKVVCSLDIRHADDAVRRAAQVRVTQFASRRDIAVRHQLQLDQPAVAMDAALTERLARAAENAPRLVSGAGHDAMILAEKIPAALLFLRSPGGISHHPDETVLDSDVEVALQTGMRFLESLA
jgi:allantoate deiminase